MNPGITVITLGVDDLEKSFLIHNGSSKLRHLYGIVLR